jgi:polyphosphate kinase
LTADPDVGADLTDLFNVLTGYSGQTEYRTLLVAPHRMRDSIVERIDAEAEAARAGQPCGIRLKANALVDEEVIDALYRASRAGVPVQCLIRGICALRPGVPGLSETVTVRSILGRYLEHSRIFHFESAGEWWIGSADMMHRNLDRRIESLVRVRDREMHEQLASMLDLAFSPEVIAWELAADGRWTRKAYQGEERLLDYQVELAREALATGTS